MVYTGQQEIRDEMGLDSGVWPDDNLDPKIKRHVESLWEGKKASIPYRLEIETNDYWGNFEREFIAYSLGILDDVQMEIRHSEDELDLFWQEVFGSSRLSFEDALENYALLQNYLLETFQEVDDWYQLCFYSIDWDAWHQQHRNILHVQLACPLDEYWESIIIPRMKNFFEVRPLDDISENTKLLGIRLLDQKGTVVKEY